ncbi:MAG: ABC transporter substrate-binding protein [Tunicatimonas sp.]
MKLTLALDWSPNTLHAGYFIAEAEGYFKDNLLDVTFVTPEEDNYATTPAKKLADWQVHVAVAPSESVISFNTLPDAVPLVAIAAVLQEDASAIVTRSDSGITRPAQLDGRTFASYQARFEDDIVRQLVRADGGQGDLVISSPDKLEMWRTVAEGTADATWVFLPWEGLKARHEAQVAFNAFRLSDYRIPYGYSPLLITHEELIEQEPNLLRAFVRAVEKGWRFVNDHPGRAAEILCDHIRHPDFRNREMIKESLDLLQPAILDDSDRWGFMDGTRWLAWVEWMIDTKVLKDISGTPINFGQIDTSMFYTNDFFK